MNVARIKDYVQVNYSFVSNCVTTWHPSPILFIGSVGRAHYTLLKVTNLLGRVVNSSPLTTALFPLRMPANFLINN